MTIAGVKAVLTMEGPDGKTVSMEFGEDVTIDMRNEILEKTAPIGDFRSFELTGYVTVKVTGLHPKTSTTS